MEKFFRLKEHGTDVRTEFVAGLTTFMAMAYILMVNANMFADPYGIGGVEGQLLGVSYGAIYIATAISAIVGTVLIGLLANLPLAQASGMGLNAYFVYTLCLTLGLTYANALVLVLLDGVIFIVLTVTGLRKKIFDAIPHTVRVAIPAGIGLFIAFLGLQNAGLVIKDSSTGVALASFNIFSGTATWATIMPLLVTFFGLLAIAGLFFISMFLAPVAQLIPTYATATALIYVGVLMMNCVKEIEWTKTEYAVPAFLTMAMMPFTYNISYGIAFGIISYAVIAVFTGRAKELKFSTWVLVLLFAMTFFLTH